MAEHAATAGKGWRLAKSLLTGQAELNAAYPNRTQGAQEGTVGDLAHKAESFSDHNPNSAGVVRAWDIDATHPDFDHDGLANHVAVLLAQHHPAFGQHGYVIWNRRIFSVTTPRWIAYTGSDPHTQHIHVSVGANPGEYDSTAPWGIHGTPIPTPPAPTIPTEEEDDMPTPKEFADAIMNWPIPTSDTPGAPTAPLWVYLRDGRNDIHIVAADLVQAVANKEVS